MTEGASFIDERWVGSVSRCGRASWTSPVGFIQEEYTDHRGPNRNRGNTQERVKDQNTGGVNVLFVLWVGIWRLHSVWVIHFTILRAQPLQLWVERCSFHILNRSEVMSVSIVIHTHSYISGMLMLTKDFITPVCLCKILFFFFTYSLATCK